jgi:hypothetical protein
VQADTAGQGRVRSSSQRTSWACYRRRRAAGSLVLAGRLTFVLQCLVSTLHCISLTFQAWGALLNNVKSCGTEFLHQHVVTETTAASQYVVHEQTEQCQCLAEGGCATTAARAAPDPEGPDRDLLCLGNCSTMQSPGDARVFNVHYHTAYAAGQPAVHVVKVGTQPGVHMCSCLQLAHRGLPCRHYSLLCSAAVRPEPAV